MFLSIVKAKICVRDLGGNARRPAHSLNRFVGAVLRFQHRTGDNPRRLGLSTGNQALAA